MKTISDRSPDDRDRVARFVEAVRDARASGEPERSFDAWLEAFPGPVEPLARVWVLELCEEFSDGPRAFQGGPGGRLGPYVLERELGRGGQGAVWLGTDERLGRKVALKILAGAFDPDGAAADRLKREAEVVARLDHPAICPLFDVGVVAGVPYIAMRYLEGRSLSMVLNERTLFGDDDSILIGLEEEDSIGAAEVEPAERTPARAANREEIDRALAWFADVARGLHAAHEAGVVHRDVKPGNVMITDDDRAVVLDFGLARDDESGQASLTRSGDLFGTPSYMSPEQLLAHRVPIDRRTDIWSLGVVLYEALTGVRPFEGPTRHAIYSAIATREPQAPHRRNRQISKDLSVVITTALQKDVDRRYSTAAALADDLERVRAGHPVLARPIGPVGRTLRAMRRRPAVAALVVSLAILLPLVSGLAVSARSSADLAQANRRAAEAQSALRARIEEESAELIKERRAADLLRAMESAGVEMGMLIHAFGGQVAFERTVEAYLAAYREYGLALDDPQEALDQLAERIRQEFAEHPEVERNFLSGLYDLAWMIPAAMKQLEAGREGRNEPAQGAAFSELGEASVRVSALLERIEAEPWYREVWTRSQDLTTEPGKKALREFIDSQDLDALDAAQQALLGSLSYSFLGEPDLAERLFDNSLEKEPEAFLTTFVRGVLELRPPGEGETWPDRAAAAQLYLRPAVGLRPESGVAWAMFGQTLLWQGKMAAGLRALDRAVAVPDPSATVWHMRGLMLSMGAEPAQIRECFVQALALDPTFTPARVALEAIDRGERPSFGASPPDRR